jgi:hypothetical protein
MWWSGCIALRVLNLASRWEEVVVAYFKLSQHLSGVTEKTQNTSV